MSGKLYVLISWPDGSRVISMENIKEPRKPFHLYSVGEQVLARCPGFSGLYWGVVEGISGKWHPPGLGLQCGAAQKQEGV